MKSQNSIYLLGEEKIGKAILALSVPGILSAMISMIYNVVDTIYLGKFNNTAMIAATTIAVPLITIVQASADGIGIGSASYIGRLLGAKKFDDVNKVVKTSITFGGLVALILSFTMIFFIDRLLPIFSNDPEVLQYTKEYITIVLGGSIFMMYKVVLSGLIRSEGNIQLPMLATIFGVLLNVILNPIFMFDWGFNLNVKGAALATIFSQACSMLIMVWYLCRKSGYVRWRWLSFGLDFNAIKNIVKIGMASFVRHLLPSLTHGLLAIQAAVYGTDFVASIGIGRKALRLIVCVFTGMNSGLQPFFAYNYGAGNKKRIRQMLKTSLSFVTLFGLFGSLLFILFPSLVIQMFTTNAAVLTYGRLMLFGYALSLPILGIYHILAGALQSMGKAKESIYLSVAKQLVFYSPIVYILPRFLGMYGIYYAQPLTDWSTFVILLFICRKLPKELSDKSAKIANTF